MKECRIQNIKKISLTRHFCYNNKDMPLKDIERAEVTCLVDNSVDVLLPNTKVAYRPSLDDNWFVYMCIAYNTHRLTNLTIITWFLQSPIVQKMINSFTIGNNTKK